MTLKTSALTAIGALALSTGWALTFAVSPASAAVTTISSSSTVLDISLTIPNVISVTIGPLVPAAGSAPPPYNVTNSLPSLSLPLLGLTTSKLQQIHCSSYRSQRVVLHHPVPTR